MENMGEVVDAKTVHKLNVLISTLCRDARTICMSLWPYYLKELGPIRTRLNSRQNAVIRGRAQNIMSASEALKRLSDLNQLVIFMCVNIMQDACKVKDWVSYLVSIKQDAFPGRLSLETAGAQSSRTPEERLDDIALLNGLREVVMILRNNAEQYVENLVLYEIDQAKMLAQAETTQQGFILDTFQTVQSLTIGKFFVEVDSSITDLVSILKKVTRFSFQHKAIFMVPELDDLQAGHLD